MKNMVAFLVFVFGALSFADANLDLLNASAAGDVNKVGLALSHGADVNFADSNGFTALAIAANSGFLSIASMLVERGAQVDKSSDFKCPSTPLWFASYMGQDSLVSYLASQGADLHAVGGCMNETPLKIAERYQRISTVSLLRHLGVSQ